MLKLSSCLLYTSIEDNNAIISVKNTYENAVIYENGEIQTTKTVSYTHLVKVADPKWEAGKPIMSGVLDRITSKSIDALLVKSGSQLIRKSFERMI